MTTPSPTTPAPPVVTEKPRRGVAARLAGPASVLLGSALVVAQAARLRAWIVDDAAITFAYARSVAHGLGPVQQAGAARVEGYSNPSWLTVLTVGHGLGLFDHGSLFGVSDLVWFPKLLALLCVVGVLWCVRAATRSAVATLFAAAVLATNWSFVIWAFSGLENPLYGLLVAALATLLARAASAGRLPAARTAALAGVLALLAALTRPDGVIYAGAYPLALLLTVPRSALAPDLKGLTAWLVRPAALGLAVFGLPYGVFLLWRRAEFGQWVPNTAVAKAQGTPALADVWHRATDVLGYAGWAGVAVVLAAAALVLARPGAARAELVAAGVPVMLALLAFAVLQPDWMALYRFATPLWTTGALFGALALTRAWTLLSTSALPGRARGAARAVLAVAATVALTVSAVPQSASAATFRSWPTLSMCSVAKRYGLQFNTYADRLGLPRRTSSVLLPDLGGTLLTSGLRVVDLAGLTDPTIARDYATGDMAALRSYVFHEVRPTFVHVHGPWAVNPGLLPGTLRAAGYLPIYDSGARSGSSAFDSDWVRADAVSSPARLAELRTWAQHEVPALEEQRAKSPLATCNLPTTIPR